jgi:hypothetical protein
MLKAKLYVYGSSVVSAYGNKEDVILKLGKTAVGPFKSRGCAVYYANNPGITIADAERSIRAEKRERAPVVLDKPTKMVIIDDDMIDALVMEWPGVVS